MRRTLSVAAVLLVVASAIACGSDETPSPASSGDGGTDGATPPSPGATPAPDGGYCCPPDPSPGCCMSYGGWSPNGQCFAACDGMPLPSDPRWKLIDDPYGCKSWSQPSGGVKCGQAIPPDASSDASDSGTD